MTTKQDIVISTQKLTKKFGAVKALDGLDLKVSTNEVHGFLGPNGAGKSTTIRVLLGLLQKTTGDVSLFGEDPWKNTTSLHRKLAYVPGDVNLWPTLSGGEAIDLLCSLRGSVNPKKRQELIDAFDLDPTKKCRTYSKGNLQKVAIISALASDVDLYMFDEPTSGLDPLMQAVFQRQVKDLQKAGKTILLSSHMLEEVDQLCDMVTIIKDGRAIESGSLDKLKHLHSLVVTIETAKPVTHADKLIIHDLKQSGLTATFKVKSVDLDSTLKYFGKFTIRSLSSKQPTLEELFMHYYHTDNSKKQ